MKTQTPLELTLYPVFEHGPFVNCTLEKECPADWHRLVETDRDKVRHCATCAKDVHFCTDQGELDAHAAQGHCVAFYEPRATRPRNKNVRLGLPTYMVKDGIAVSYRRKRMKFLDSI